MSAAYDPLASVQAAGPPGTISFIYGLPDPATFPAEDLRRAADAVFGERPGLALQYGPEQGYGPLIDYLRLKIAREEGLALERPQIMLTGGSAQALDHICTLFTRPGDRTLVEAPTYFDALHLFRDHALLPLQIPVDEAGLVVEGLAKRLETLARSGHPARLLYTIPNFQNPSGITLAGERRQAVLDLAHRFDLVVVEDDVYRDLAYDDRPVPPSFFALDREERVLRIGSFSKILAPGLRLGWLMGPPRLIERLINSGLRNMGGGASPLVANLLSTYCSAGLLEPHVGLLRHIYSERRDVALAALGAHMPAGVRWTRPGGGFFVWITLPAPLSASAVADQARQAGVYILAGDPFFAEKATGAHLRLAFSYVVPDEIEQGLMILGRVVRALLIN